MRAASWARHRGRRRSYAVIKASVAVLPGLTLPFCGRHRSVIEHLGSWTKSGDSKPSRTTSFQRDGVSAVITVARASLVEASDAVLTSVSLPICVRFRSAFQVLPDVGARAVAPSHMG